MGCGCGGNRATPTFNVNQTAPIVAPTPIETNTAQNLEQAVPVVNETASSNTKHGYNILDVIKDKLTGKLEYAPKDVADFRLGQCHECEHLRIGVCTQCGCIVEFKVRYAQSSCPEGKW